MTRARVLLVGALAAIPLAVTASAGGANECDGLQVCVPVAGPWVVVPAARTAARPQVEYQITCPQGHVAGGLDARLSERGIDIEFLGRLGSPVNPGITTARSVVFVGSYVGSSPRAPSFRPFVGCLPAAGGTRLPTSAAALPPQALSMRRVKTVRVRPGTTSVTLGCARSERLVGASHAIGFFRSAPPSASLIEGVSVQRTVRDGRIVVRVRGDAELGGTRVVVQVHAVCARAR